MQVDETIIKELEEATSTNTLLTTWIKEENVPEGSILVARRQTQGRGQKGNSWHSLPYENLTFSMVLYPLAIHVTEQFVLSQLTALAVREVLLDKYTDISIKWPNDIYAGDRKIAGILIENNLNGKQIASCILGIGLNVNQAVFPEELPNPVSLYQLTGKKEELSQLLQALQTAIYTRYQFLLAQPDKAKEQIHSEFCQALYRKEGYHLYQDKLKNETIRAAIDGVAPNGVFTLRLENGEQRSYLFKEIEYIL